MLGLSWGGAHRSMQLLRRRPWVQFPALKKMNKTGRKCCIFVLGYLSLFVRGIGTTCATPPLCHHNDFTSSSQKFAWQMTSALSLVISTYYEFAFCSGKKWKERSRIKHHVDFISVPLVLTPL
jgi:hypothetical protein